MKGELGLHNNDLQDVTAAVAKNRRKSTWKRIVSVLACIVVFCTTYALILPALTLEKDAECGLEEHTHTEACYIRDDSSAPEVLVCTAETLGLHVHTDACIGIDGEYICGYSDFVIHSHNEYCYDESGMLVCTLPEIFPHIHTDSCYLMTEDAGAELNGGFDGVSDNSIDNVSGHIHTDECYVNELGELICTLPTEAAHVHTDECYLTTNQLTCPLPEGEGHIHGEGCFDEAGALVCTVPESAGHTHTPECYTASSELICTIAEGEQIHVHTDECYAQSKVLVCDIEEGTAEPFDDGTALPSFEDGAFNASDQQDGWVAEPSFENNTISDRGEPICGMTEIIPHCHDDSCFDANGMLICGMTEVLEHIHTQECMGKQDDSDELTCTIAEGDGAHIHTVEGGCFDEEGTLICELEESEGHVHSAICYGNWTLVCGIEEHTHTEECYSSDEPAADPARIAYCGKEEHTHAGDCINENGVVVCLIEEHKHGEECYAEENALAFYEAAARIYVNTEQTNSVSMLMAANSGIMPYANASSVDFKKYITKATLMYLKDGKWEPVPSGYKVKNGETVGFNIDYTLEQGTLNGSDTIIYQLPEAIQVIEMQTGTVYDYLNKAVGTYEINTGGLITIKIDPNVVSDNAKGPTSGYIRAKGTIDSSKADTGDDIAFNDKVKIDTSITILPPDNSDVSVSKSGPGIINDDGTITYTVTVSSVNGTTDSVTLEDVITTGQNMTLSNVKIDGKEVGTPALDNGRFTLDLGALDKNSSKEITYTYTMPDGWKDSTVDITVGNKVKATTKKNDDTPVTSNESDVSITHKQTYLGKRGALSDDKSEITWTVTINAGGHNIGNWGFSDTLNGAPLPDTAFPLTLEGQNGAENIVISNVELLQSFVFPEDCNGTYIINYTTPAIAAPGTSVASNDVKLDDPNPETPDPEIKVDIPVDKTFQPVSKEALSVSPDPNNPSTALVTWKVKISATDGTLIAPWTYTDNVVYNYHDCLQYLTQQQYSDICSAVAVAVNNKYKYTISENHLGDGTFVGFTINFQDSLPQGETIEFTYTSTGKIRGDPAGENYINEGKYNNSDVVRASIKYITLLEKHDPSDRNKPITYHDYQDCDGVLNWEINVTPPETTASDYLTVIENLPEGLDFVEVKLKTNDGGWETNDIKDAGLHPIPTWGRQFDIKTVRDGNVLKIMLSKEFVERQYGLYTNNRSAIFTITVKAQIKGEYKFTKDPTNNLFTGTFKNEVILKDGDALLDEKFQTQIVTKTPLRKNDNTDKNKQETTHNYEQLQNQEMQWEILVTPPDDFAGDTFEITELLPHGVTLTKCQLIPNRSFSSNDMVSDGIYKFSNGTNNYDVTKKQIELQEGQKVTISIPKTFIDEHVTFKLYVNAKINDDCKFTQEGANNLTASFKNEVSISGGISVNQTQKINKKPTQNLTKTVGEVKDNIVPYELKINPDGNDIVQDTDELTLTDTLVFPSSSGATANLVGDSLNVYKINEDGTEALLDIPYTLVYSQAIRGGWEQIEVYTITMKVPDSTPLRVVYKYAIKNGTLNQQISLSNTAELQGDTQKPDGEKKDTSFNISDSAAGITTGSFSLEKVDSENTGKHLSGAEFELYKWVIDETTGNGDWHQVNTDKDGKEIKFISDENGMVNFGELDVRTAYYCKETKAPEGYTLSEEIKKFYIRENLSDTVEVAPDDFNGTGYPKGITIRFQNESTTTSLKVRKLWKDDKGNAYEPTVDNIQFNLYRQIIGADGVKLAEEPYPGNETIGYGAITIGKSTDWMITLDNLEKYGKYEDKDVTYKYYVEEINTNPDINVTYSDNQTGVVSGTITITNTVDTAPKHELPSTGGGGKTKFLSAGAGLMLIALLALLRKPKISAGGGADPPE